MLLWILAITVSTNFEAGRIGRVERIRENHLRCEVPGETDQDGRNRQPSWFYFRLDGVAGRELTLELAGLHGEYNYRRHDGSGHRHMRPVYSYDNRAWRHFESSEWDGESAAVRVRLRAEKDPVWIARQPPYTTAHLQRLMAELRRHPHFRRRMIGRSVEGRPLWLLSVTNPRLPDSGKKVVWLMARQHAWESGTSWVTEGALRWLLSDDAQAARVREAFSFQVLPMADPDGVYRGGVRYNRHGYDLNRNWDAVDPGRMPEIYAQRKAILDWVDAGRRIDLFLTLHNTESRDYVQGPLSAGGLPMRRLAESLWEALVEMTAFHSPAGPLDQPETKTSGAKGRMTVTEGLFYERRIPAFLMELMVDPSPRLGRPPTVEDRLEFGAGLVRALCRALTGRGSGAPLSGRQARRDADCVLKSTSNGSRGKAGDPASGVGPPDRGIAAGDRRAAPTHRPDREGRGSASAQSRGGSRRLDGQPARPPATGAGSPS